MTSLKKNYPYPASMYKELIVVRLHEDKDEEFQRYRMLLYKVIYSTANKGKGTFQLKLKNNTPTPEVYEKLRNYFLAEGFKVWGNAGNGFFYLGVSWI